MPVFLFYSGLVPLPQRVHTCTVPLAEKRSRNYLFDNSISKVHILNPDAVYILGDEIIVRVDVLNCSGNIRHLGGDDIRIYIRGSHPGTNAAGHVTDHVNGSYSGTFNALWVGMVEVVVVIAGTREGTSLFDAFHEEPDKSVPCNGQFISGNGSVYKTSCSPFPSVRGSTTVCNLTQLNYGMPWFCTVGAEHTDACHTWNLTMAEGFGSVPKQQLLDFRYIFCFGLHFMYS
jgi:hypothetical protein